MTEAHADAREQLRDIAAELESIRLRLLGIHKGGVPAPAREAGEEEDAVVTLRSVIECVVRDSLEPAIRDLRREATSSPDLDTTWEPPVV
jgi:hypothetical protein